MAFVIVGFSLTNDQTITGSAKNTHALDSRSFDSRHRHTEPEQGQAKPSPPSAFQPIWKGVEWMLGFRCSFEYSTVSLQRTI